MDYHLKNRKVYRTNFIGARCTDREKNILQSKANLYAQGNLSAYLLFAAMNYDIKRSDLKEKGPEGP